MRKGSLSLCVAVTQRSAFPSASNSAAWWDADGDGWLDLYVGNDFSDRDEFYRNRGDGTFAKEDAVKLGMPETHWTLAVNSADFDGDGWADIYAASDFWPDGDLKRTL